MVSSGPHTQQTDTRTVGLAFEKSRILFIQPMVLFDNVCCSYSIQKSLSCVHFFFAFRATYAYHQTPFLFDSVDMMGLYSFELLQSELLQIFKWIRSSHIAQYSNQIPKMAPPFSFTGPCRFGPTGVPVVDQKLSVHHKKMATKLSFTTILWAVVVLSSGFIASKWHFFQLQLLIVIEIIPSKLQPIVFFCDKQRERGNTTKKVIFWIQVKEAYFKKTLALHPDKHGDNPSATYAYSQCIPLVVQCKKTPVVYGLMIVFFCGLIFCNITSDCIC